MASKPVPAKKKSTPAIDDSQEVSSTTINTNKQAKDDSYKIIRTATTPSLSGACDLEYQLGLSESGDLYLRIHSSSGTGIYCRQWSSLDEAWQCLKDWPHGPVTAMALFPIFRNRSINSPGYVIAALLDMGLLIPSQEKPRHFDLVDDDRFDAIVAELKASHTTPRKRKPRVKA